MAYATYDYYVTSYYGDVLTLDNFDKYATRASDYIDRITMNRAASYTRDDAVKKACCALAEQMSKAESAYAAVGSGEIASESVGSHSVSYRSGAEVVASIDAEQQKIAVGYLANTGLLYRGVPCIRRIP